MHENISKEEVDKIRKQHQWIVDPIEKAASSIQESPFFEWLKEMTTPLQFGESAKQLFYHSVTFPKGMSLMGALSPIKKGKMLPFYTGHAYTEADHHQILLDWMLKHKIIRRKEDIFCTIPSLETNNCINLAYELAIEQNEEKWIAGINTGIELCSNLFFQVVAKKMHDIGAGHEYFDIHVEADQYHSVMGLEYISDYSSNPEKGAEILDAALRGISLWGSMINSWVGIFYIPKFRQDGSIFKLAIHGNDKVLQTT